MNPIPGFEPGTGGFNTLIFSFSRTKNKIKNGKQYAGNEDRKSSLAHKIYFNPR